MDRRYPARSARVAVLAVAVSCAASLSAAQPPASSADVRLRAVDLAYNLDHAEAIDLLRQAITASPDDAALHRTLASVLWLRILFERGAVTVDHYLGGFTRTTVDLPPPRPALDAEFKKEIARAIELSERHVARAPHDPQAHDDLGSAIGLQASYTATVEGRMLAGFKAARRSYDEQEKALDLDPSRTDAGVIVGTYRYLVSTLSFPMRLMAYVSGFGGGKERGIRMVEAAAAGSDDAQTEARFALILMYNREARYDDALRVLDRLRRRYPRNRLVLLEAGSTALRGRNAANAETLLSEGLAMFASDRREKMPGEAGLWHYKRGAARAALGRTDEARADLDAALAAGTAGWVQGRAHVELARLAAREGDRHAAEREARLARSLCEHARDPVCVADARQIARR